MTHFSHERNNDDETDVMADQSPLQILTTENGSIIVASEQGTTIMKADGTSESYPLQPTMDSPTERKEA